MSCFSRLCRLMLWGIVPLLLAPATVRAQTPVNWNGSTDASWGTAANWDVLPTSDLTTNIANFNLPVYGGNPVFAPHTGTFSIAGITIGASNGAMTLSGTAVSLGASGITIASGAAAFTLAPTTLTTLAAQTWTNNSANPFTVSSNVLLSTNTVLTLAGSGSTTFTGTITQDANRTITTTGTTRLNGDIFLSDAAGTSRNLTLNGANGNLVINGIIANFNGGPGTASNLIINNALLLVTLNAANTYTGNTTVTAGIINLNNTTAFGGSGTVNLNGATLDNTSGAAITLANNNPFSIGGTVLFSGTNDLNLGTGTANLTSSRSLSPLAGNLTVGGIITGVAASTLTKIGSGTLTLTGANTYAGNTTINGGNLIFDFSASDPTPATGGYIFSVGKITLRGKGTATPDTLASTSFSNAVGSNGSLVLDSNSGAGIQLIIASLITSNSTLSSNFIDTSSSFANTVSVSAFAGNATSGTGNVILLGASAGQRANLILRDAANIGFATRDNIAGPTLGLLSPLTTGTTLTASSTGATTNFRLTFADTVAGTLTRTANLDFQTLTIDSSGGAITLEMGANSLPLGGLGRGVLYIGNNDVSITRTTGTVSGGSSFQYNYGTGTVNFGLPFNASTGGHLFGGPGFFIYSGTYTAVTQGFHTNGGLVRAVTPQNLNALTTVPFTVTEGVFEIGADLNGAAVGDLSLVVKALATGTSGFSFFGDSGLSAFGANRVVNFGGASATLTWGTAGFLTSPGAVNTNSTFRLSSLRSDSSIEIQNPIAFGTTMRIVEVANGSSAIDGILSGLLSGTSNNFAPAFLKTGLGTLSFTGANTYSGTTRVSAGTLLVNGNQSAATGAVIVNANAILGGQGSIGGAVTLNPMGTLRPGDVTAVGTLTLGNALSTGPGSVLSLRITDGTTPGSNGGSTIGLPMPTSNNFLAITAGTTTIDPATIIVIDGTGVAFASAPYSYQIASGAGNQSALNITTQSQFTPIGFLADSFSLTGSAGGAVYLNFTPIPEPGLWLAMGLLSGLVLRSRRLA